MAKNSAATKKRNATASGNKQSAAKNLHVVRHTEGWIIRSEGSMRVRSLHNTQREAVETARALAKREGITLVIHSSDGRVKVWESHSRDPKPRREPHKVLYPTTPPRTASVAAIKKAVREAISEVANNGPKKIKSSNELVRESRT